MTRQTNTLVPSDMKGLWAFVPACSTPDAADLNAVDTIDTDALTSLVDRLVRDGVDGIVTTGSAGESHTLTDPEYRTLITTVMETVNGRVPVFVGASTLNTRESIRRARLIADLGADGIMSGPPMYLPQTTENAVQYYKDLAEAVPELAIMIYQNPHAFRITLPPAAFRELAQVPNVVALKQTSMDIFNVIGAIKAVKDKMSVLVLDQLMYPAMMFGAAGAWSIDVCMGPWPALSLRDACQRGDWTEATAIADQMQAPFRTLGLTMEEFQAMQSAWWKIAIDTAGYGRAGAARPPFVHIPKTVVESAHRYGQRWAGLAERYHRAREAAGLRPAPADGPGIPTSTSGKELQGGDLPLSPAR
ncbi:dihydrodipicolinate synthase family protein [Mycobacterium sp. 050128]|nr:dihydrodipicolinate synthase family protein [Mycobacterium intracellulare]ARV80199.1 dihydrodipicolinate synthetase [Mycobacterium intracellulare subsp. chimaera]ASL18841.1 dihydrodipicolinate synthase/N-acetylneuraminate lyase [Mycobacterium intracellulare subsp. chimaera]ETZ38640.1 dihydrodipicolinate synthetase family protein [Mycobacterium intracellulare MIN_052511_1280]KPN45894.1 dihydrodipicolinate synthetase [Mycobacterium intracellulare subsp. chimaera]KPN47709.1 dihydrodipicolinate